MEFMEDTLKGAVENYLESRVEVAKAVGTAKQKMKKKEYMEMIKLSGLSKDQVSLCLKRFQLLEMGFGEHYISDYSDGQVKLLTNKKVDENAELIRARKQLSDNDLDWAGFKMLYDSFKVVKTDDEKVVKKADDLMKFIDKKNIGAEAMLEVAEICKPLREYMVDEEDKQ